MKKIDGSVSSPRPKHVAPIYDASNPVLCGYSRHLLDCDTVADFQELSRAFISSDTFVGRREGYVFRSGDQGLGYYLDEPHGNISHQEARVKVRSSSALQPVPLSEAENASRRRMLLQSTKRFIAADRWLGPKPGYCFQRGHTGLGYYQDQNYHAALPSQASDVMPPKKQ